jgi:hypothetical protein
LFQLLEFRSIPNDAETFFFHLPHCELVCLVRFGDLANELAERVTVLEVLADRNGSSYAIFVEFEQVQFGSVISCDFVYGDG